MPHLVPFLFIVHIIYISKQLALAMFRQPRGKVALHPTCVLMQAASQSHTLVSLQSIRVLQGR